MKKKRAIFIDKDGCLIPDIPYNINPDVIILANGAGETLSQLKKQGYLLILITNQSGIARGYFKEDALPAVWEKINKLLRENNVQLDDVFYCPHNPEDNCKCRKPKPGNIQKAIKKYNIDSSKSWMIGDILNDVEAGNRGGCKTILLNTGNETEWREDEYRHPTYSVEKWSQVLSVISKENKYE